MVRLRVRDVCHGDRVGASAVNATTSFDLPLIRTRGKAFYWQRMIGTGEVANASELARRLKL